MRIGQYILPGLALATGFFLSLAAAYFAVNVVENRSQNDVERVLGLNGYDWAEVNVDGLQVLLSGFAPDEATRFGALTAAGTVVDSARVVDMMNVTRRDPIQPPKFSIEILRNRAGISLIGLVPASMDREKIVAKIETVANGAEVTDLLDEADFKAPENWDNALTFGLEAMALLPRSKISISADQVELKAISDSITEKRRLESELARKAPDGLRLAVEITAPRPVITPYTLRFLIDEQGARFDACSTDTEAGKDRILAAATAAGLSGMATCTIGLGIPSPSWDDAVVTGISYLSQLGAGSITFSDADVTLVVPENTPQQLTDLVVGELEAALPDVFSLHVVLPRPVTIDGSGEDSDGPPEFVATRSPEGLVQLRGRVLDDRTRIATESFAEAQFGSSVVNGAMRLDSDLPSGWSTRVLASLQALAILHHGSAVTQPDIVEIRGVSGQQDARSEISRILSKELGESQDFRISVSYDKKYDPLAAIPTPEECIGQIATILNVSKITFAPSSADIDETGLETIDTIADVLKKCEDIAIEVGGHTDSQGREVMNKALSQSRAEAVIAALMNKRVVTSNLTAVGYGETVPIADNDTEEGREENRRIEFKLILPEENQPAEPVDDAALADETQTAEAEEAPVDEAAPEDATADTPENAEQASPEADASGQPTETAAQPEPEPADPPEAESPDEQN